MLFRRQKRQTRIHAGRLRSDGPEDGSGLYPIEFDAMLKGSIHKRGSGEVRQFGVTVDGSTRLVTSGDVVDRKTYEALLSAGAVRPVSVEAPSSESPFGEAPSREGPVQEVPPGNALSEDEGAPE